MSRLIGFLLVVAVAVMVVDGLPKEEFPQHYRARQVWLMKTFDLI